MKRKLAIALALILGVVGFVAHERHYRHFSQIATSPNSLTGDQHEKVVIDTQRKTVTTVTRAPGGGSGNGGSTVTKVEKLGPKTIISEDNEGRITVTTFTHGFIFRPGTSLFYTDRARLGFDAKLYYYNGFSVVSGLGLSQVKAPNLDAYIGLSYDIPLATFSNTSVFVGYSARKDVAVGIRIGF